MNPEGVVSPFCFILLVRLMAKDESLKRWAHRTVLSLIEGG